MELSHKPKDVQDGHSNCSHGHKTQEKKRLIICMALVLVTMLAEVVGGYLSGSLALLSDAGHMFTDFFALLGSFFAMLIASKPVNSSKTYGYYRAEVIAAFLNGVFLIAVSIFIVVEAYERYQNPQPVAAGIMLAIGFIGLAVNFLTAFLLHGVKKNDLNLRSAYLHMLSDAASSVAVVVAAIWILLGGWTKIDSILSVFISVMIFFWAFRVVKDSVHVLMESTPQHINLEEVKETLKREVPGIQDLHDVHIWEITSNMYAMTAHVNVMDCLVSENSLRTEKVQKILSERYHIEHVNLQYECD